jgi:uncharacterized protein
MTAVMEAVRGDEATGERRSSPRVAVWQFHAEEVARAGLFYRELFDWRFAPVVDGLWGSVEAERQAGLDAAASITAGAPLLFPYVDVADLEATLAVVERLGGRTALPPWQADATTRLAVFTDPEGNRVGLIERRRGATVTS